MSTELREAAKRVVQATEHATPLNLTDEIATLRAVLSRLEQEARIADHMSIDDGPAFARGIRYAIASLWDTGDGAS